MKVINTKKEIKIFETKFCHACSAYLTYIRYPHNPLKNKGYVICDNCGAKQRVYDPYLKYAQASKYVNKK